MPENEDSNDAETNFVDGMNIEEEPSNIIHPIEENVGFVATQSRRDVEPKIVVLSSKDVEQRNILDDDFIDDDCLDEEL